MTRTRSVGSLQPWWEIARPFSFTATVVPALVGASAAWAGHRWHLALLPLCLLGLILMQAGTNMVNEVFDLAQGVDGPESPRASHVLVDGRLPSRAAHRMGLALIVGGVAVGGAVSIFGHLGPLPFVCGVIGGLAGWAYTAPPLQCKYRGWGLPLEALVMGPLLVLGAAFVQAGRVVDTSLAASAPIMLLVAAILIGNDLRDAEGDRAAGIRTLPAIIGWEATRALFQAVVLASFLLVVVEVAAGLLPPPALLALGGLPLGWCALTAVRGVPPREAARLLARLDQQAAGVYLLTGLLLCVGLLAVGLGA